MSDSSQVAAEETELVTGAAGHGGSTRAGHPASLSVTGLTKTYKMGRDDVIYALRDLHLHCEGGDWLTIVGTNGAGKSTLLRTVAGVIKADAGRVDLDGRDITRLADYRRARFIARIEQDSALNVAASLTIAENLAIASMRGKPRRLRIGVTARRRRTFADALVVLGMGLERRLDSPVLELSGGQRQALALVMATMSHARLLLLDEHTGQLDPTAVERVMEVTDQLVTRSAMTTLMVTHNVEHALRFGNRLIMMDRGRVMFELSVEEKRATTTAQLLERFAKESGSALVDEELLFSDATTSHRITPTPEP